LGKEVDIGLLEVLAGTARIEDVLLQDTAGVCYIPLAKGSYTPKDVFGSSAMDRVLEMLKQKFDIIVLDTAPVIPVVDTRILARKADSTVVLARWRKTPRKAIISALQMLQDSKVNIAGVALTQVDVKEQAKYGYGDSGYYYKSYKKYYTE
jgi:Mrp family chromosome partitioning ATPase